MTQIVTALFDSYEDATEAVGELERASIAPVDISIISRDGPPLAEDDDDEGAASGAGAGAGIGAAFGGATGLLAGLGMIAIPGLGPVVAAGWLASTAVGAGAGAVIGAAGGGIIGAMTAAGVADEDAHAYAEGVRRGGTLVSARVSDDDVAKAGLILERKQADIAIRSKAYQEAGWTRFDETKPPDTEGEVQRARERLDSYR